MASDVKGVTRNSGNLKCSSSASLSVETQSNSSKRMRLSMTDTCNINAVGAYYNSLQVYKEIVPPCQYNSEEIPDMHFSPLFKRSETFQKATTSSFLPTSITHDYYSSTYLSDDHNYQLDPALEINKNTFKGLQTLRQLPTACTGLETSEGSQGPYICVEALAEIHTPMATKKRSTRFASSGSSISNKHKQSVTKPIGSPDNPGGEEQKALVLYGNNGSIVPFGGETKKRPPRAKVELDNETHRVWKLLLEDINSEGINGTDEEKAKWWEEEREVFRLRTESFIARMHEVQGNRRFTPWKGSVVDSVVGVFLTQNVSDHLSSSAFMSMAARFPVKQRALNPNDTVECHRKVSSPHTEIHGSMSNVEEVNTKIFFGNTSKVTEETIHSILDPSYASECLPKLDNEPDRDKISSLANFNGDQRELDETISSQNSVVSPHNSAESIGQTVNRSESWSQSSTEAETTDLAAYGHTSYVKLLQMAETISHGVYSPGFRNISSHLENSSEGILGNFQSVNSEYQQIDTSEDSPSSVISKHNELCLTEQSGLSPESSGTSSQNTAVSFEGLQKFPSENFVGHVIANKDKGIELLPKFHNQERIYEGSHPPISSGNDLDNLGKPLTGEKARDQKAVESNSIDCGNPVDTAYGSNPSTSKAKRRKTNGNPKKEAIKWDELRKHAQANGKREKTLETMDSVDWEAVRRADVKEIAETIKERGMNNMLAERIKDFLNRMVKEHDGIDLEWLRDIKPDRAKDFLLSIRGLGLKSVECVRLLTLHHLAFPVDTNVGRIAVRLGWVPLQPLPESIQLHLLEMYPVLESIQKYLWPRLCKLDQPTLYELHYQMITFGKVFCTKSKPNCNACPMRAECRHFASAYASARLALPAPEERRIVSATKNVSTDRNVSSESVNHLQLPQLEAPQQLKSSYQVRTFPIIEEPKTPEAIVEEPKTPEPEKTQVTEIDIEDAFCEDDDEIPVIKLNLEELNQTLHNYIQQNIQVKEDEISKALVVLNAEAASIPTPKLKSIRRLRTEHQVYELPDNHPLLRGFDRREPDDPSPYLLAIWTPGETVNSIQPLASACCFQETGQLCDRETCFACNSIREANTNTVRGTLLIPCRTAMRGSFPLNGTYFQVNEMFADHESSLNPVDVPRDWLWNLPRRTVYFGTSIPTIFKGLSQPEIQYCFWKGFVCVRGFDRKSRAPRPLVARLHFPASKLTRTKGKTKE